MPAACCLPVIYLICTEVARTLTMAGGDATFYAVRRTHDNCIPGGAINLRNLGNLFYGDRRYLPLPSMFQPLIPLSNYYFFYS